jgi:hypothetical protein
MNWCAGRPEVTGGRIYVRMTVDTILDAIVELISDALNSIGSALGGLLNNFENGIIWVVGELNELGNAIATSVKNVVGLLATRFSKPITRSIKQYRVALPAPNRPNETAHNTAQGAATVAHSTSVGAAIEDDLKALEDTAPLVQLSRRILASPTYYSRVGWRRVDIPLENTADLLHPQAEIEPPRSGRIDTRPCSETQTMRAYLFGPCSKFGNQTVCSQAPSPLGAHIKCEIPRTFLFREQKFCTVARNKAIDLRRFRYETYPIGILDALGEELAHLGLVHFELFEAALTMELAQERQSCVDVFDGRLSNSRHSIASPGLRLSLGLAS